jgi:catechol 2,3-dioxygenase-like lactoylglutathione lyase family enzyme
MTSFLNQNKKKDVAKKRNTSPSKKAISAANDLGMDLGKGWNPYSREVRLHIYVKDMKEMVKFYNKFLEFPVVHYWRGQGNEGTMLDIGGNIIELYNKNGTYHKYNKNFYGNVSLSLRVNSVHNLYNKFSKKNINIGELEDNSWGDASFEIIDIEGNRIIFFSPTIDKTKYYSLNNTIN